MGKGHEHKQDKGLSGERQEEEDGQRILYVNKVEEEGRASNKGIDVIAKFSASQGKLIVPLVE